MRLKLIQNQWTLCSPNWDISFLKGRFAAKFLKCHFFNASIVLWLQQKSLMNIFKKKLVQEAEFQ